MTSPRVCALVCAALVATFLASSPTQAVLMDFERVLGAAGGPSGGGLDFSQGGSAALVAGGLASVGGSLPMELGPIDTADDLERQGSLLLGDEAELTALAVLSHVLSHSVALPALSSDPLDVALDEAIVVEAPDAPQRALETVSICTGSPRSNC